MPQDVWWGDGVRELRRAVSLHARMGRPRRACAERGGASGLGKCSAGKGRGLMASDLERAGPQGREGTKRLWAHPCEELAAGGHTKFPSSQ